MSEDDGFDFFESGCAVAEATENENFDVNDENEDEILDFSSYAENEDAVDKFAEHDNQPENLSGNESIAEVILIGTSLGSFRHKFFSSLRVSSFLNCKRVLYFMVDVNRDVSQGANLADQELIKSWMEADILQVEANSESKGTSRLVIPQVLIDGVSIGGSTELQDLEEDGDLDWILSRKECGACLRERSPDSTVCLYCGVNFQELVSEDLINENRIQQIYKGRSHFHDGNDVAESY